jgi:hypothetical protein
MTEAWKTIAEAPDYEVSDQGRVRRVVPDWQGKYLGRVLRPSNLRGYAGHTLCTDDGKITRKVHRLVCEAFNGPCPPDKSHCAHRDGDRTNNTPGNLYWATAQENADDRERHGRTPRGDASGARLHPEKQTRGDNHWTRRHPERVARGDNHPKRLRPEIIPRGESVGTSKLAEADVVAILQAPTGHGSGKMLAERYGVSMGLVSAIRKRRAWTYLSDR